jgi:hypothetical protein
VFLFSIRLLSKTDWCFDARGTGDGHHSCVRRES